jgi:hypothetical protein
MSQVVTSLSKRRTPAGTPSVKPLSPSHTPVRGAAAIVVDPSVPLLKLITALADGGFDVAFDPRRHQLVVRESPLD